MKTKHRILRHLTCSNPPPLIKNIKNRLRKTHIFHLNLMFHLCSRLYSIDSEWEYCEYLWGIFCFYRDSGFHTHTQGSVTLGIMQHNVESYKTKTFLHCTQLSNNRSEKPVYNHMSLGLLLCMLTKDIFGMALLYIGFYRNVTTVKMKRSLHFVLVRSLQKVSPILEKSVHQQNHLLYLSCPNNPTTIQPMQPSAVTAAVFMEVPQASMCWHLTTMTSCVLVPKYLQIEIHITLLYITFPLSPPLCY